MPLKKIDEREVKSKTINLLKTQDKTRKKPRKAQDKKGNPAVVTEYEDARENQMINRDIPTMKKGGICRGAGAAIKGTKFEGVF